MIRHCVLLTFVDATSDREVDTILAGLNALPALIPEIKSYTASRDLGISKGNVEFAIVGDFATEADYLTYASHPEHVKVVTELIKPVLATRAATQIQLS